MPWLRRIADAKSQDDVLAACREYVAQLSPSELALLPKEFRPSSIGGPEELRAYALALVRYHAHGDDARLVLRLADFFSKATEQLNRLPPRPH